MNLRLQNQCAPRTAARGTTLPELLVAMGILLLIFLVMSSLVSGIQKIFRGGRAQADAIENGRAAMDMIVRDIEQMADNAAFDNCVVFAETARVVGTNKFYQGNEFFCTTYDTNWHAIAYGFYDRAGAFSNLANNVSGRLYRWQMNQVPPNVGNITNLWRAYTNSVSASYSPVVDGVVHFRIQPIRGAVLAQAQPPPAPPLRYSPPVLPTHVEIELGIVETRFAEDLAGRSSADQAALLAANLNKVYFFRQLVPIKNGYK